MSHPLCSLTVFSAALGMLSSCNGDAPWNSSVKYGSLTYAGQTYKTVKIGTQTWMAENLNVKVNSSRCYDDNADMCSKYGRLYQWSDAMGLDSSYNTKLWSGTLPRQGICPTGWHLPSDEEWTVLSDYVGTDDAGTKLKSTSGWERPLLADKSGNGTDTYGFRALPSGYYSDSCNLMGTGSLIWSSTEYDENSISPRALGSGPRKLFSLGNSKQIGCAVRCLKDGP